ncbi:hypothetical protein B4U79_00563 [Dinothrombium tinctorium]|uniref:Chitin-binding type-2 domain-containing protein n=1 Tax=Dinothrombium tinctorium TaxID=1965070 RepID=A0A3S3PQ04_9ACAR|nr:hypothetical protein B4U79_00563 [Dinothrombium tinctorium]
MQRLIWNVVILITCLDYGLAKTLSEQHSSSSSSQKSDEDYLTIINTNVTSNSGEEIDDNENPSSSLELVYSPDNKNVSDDSSIEQQISLATLSTSKEDPLQKILPKVKFNCRGMKEGYYPDIDFDCEVFHYCKTNGFRFTFVCPPKQRFNQRHMTCDYDPPGINSCTGSGQTSKEAHKESEKASANNELDKTFDYVVQTPNATVQKDAYEKESKIDRIHKPADSDSSSPTPVFDPLKEMVDYSSHHNMNSKIYSDVTKTTVSDSKSLQKYMKEVSDHKRNHFRESETIKSDGFITTPNIKALSVKFVSNAASAEAAPSITDSFNGGKSSSSSSGDNVKDEGFKPIAKSATRNKHSNVNSVRRSPSIQINSANIAPASFGVISANNTSLFGTPSNEESFKPIYKDLAMKNRLKMSESKSVSTVATGEWKDTIGKETTTTPSSIKNNPNENNLLNHKMTTASLINPGNLHSSFGSRIPNHNSKLTNDDHNFIRHFYSLLDQTQQNQQKEQNQYANPHRSPSNQINTFSTPQSTRYHVTSSPAQQSFQQQSQLLQNQADLNNLLNQYQQLRQQQYNPLHQPFQKPLQQNLQQTFQQSLQQPLHQTFQHSLQQQASSLVHKSNPPPNSEDEKSLPNYFFGLPKLSSKTNTPQFNALITQLQAAGSAQVGYPYTSDLNAVLPKNLAPGQTYRLPIGRKPPPSNIDSLKQWLTPKTRDVLNQPLMSASSQKMFSYIEPPSQFSSFTNRIPIISQLTRFFQSFTTPKFQQFASTYPNSRVSTNLLFNSEDFQNMNNFLDQNNLQFMSEFQPINVKKSDSIYSNIRNYFTSKKSNVADQSQDLISTQWYSQNIKRQQDSTAPSSASRFGLRRLFSKSKKQGRRRKRNVEGFPPFPGAFVPPPIMDEFAASDPAKSQILFNGNPMIPNPPLPPVPIYRDERYNNPYIEHIAFSDNEFKEYTPIFLDKFPTLSKQVKPFIKYPYAEFTPVVFKRQHTKRPPLREKVPVEFKDGMISITIRPKQKTYVKSYKRQPQFDDTMYSYERLYENANYNTVPLLKPALTLEPRFPKSGARSKPRKQYRGQEYNEHKQYYARPIERPVVEKAYERPTFEKEYEKQYERPVVVERPVENVVVERPHERYPEERPYERPREEIQAEAPTPSPTPIYVPVKEPRPVPPYERPHPNELRDDQHSKNSHQQAKDIHSTSSYRSKPGPNLQHQYNFENYDNKNKIPATVHDIPEIPEMSNFEDKQHSSKQTDGLLQASTSHPTTGIDQNSNEYQNFERQPQYEMSFKPVTKIYNVRNEKGYSYGTSIEPNSMTRPEPKEEPKEEATPPSYYKSNKLSLFKRPRPDFTKLAYKYKPSILHTEPTSYVQSKKTLAAPYVLSTSISTEKPGRMSSFGERLKNRYKRPVVSVKTSYSTSRSVSANNPSRIQSSTIAPKIITSTSTTIAPRFSYATSFYKSKHQLKPRIRYQGPTSPPSALTTTSTSTTSTLTPSTTTAYAWTGYYYHPAKIHELPTTNNPLNLLNFNSKSTSDSKDQTDNEDNISNDDYLEEASTSAPTYKKVFSANNSGSLQRHSTNGQRIKLFDTKNRPNYFSSFYTTQKPSENDSTITTTSD